MKNQLHALAMSEGVCRKKKLFTAKGRKDLEGLALGPWASYRRQELLRMFDELAARTAQLDAAVEQAAKSQPLESVTHLPDEYTRLTANGSGARITPARE